LTGREESVCNGYERSRRRARRRFRSANGRPELSGEEVPRELRISVILFSAIRKRLGLLFSGKSAEEARHRTRLAKRLGLCKGLILQRH
jgi:hypothetical protein